MGGEELVKRIRRGDQHRDRRTISASCPTRLLSRACDCARIPDQDCRAQSADIDSQFKRIRGNDSFYRTIAQALFDLTALMREVARAIAAYLGIGNRDASRGVVGRIPIPDSRLSISLKIRQNDFNTSSGPRKDYTLNILRKQIICQSYAFKQAAFS